MVCVIVIDHKHSGDHQPGQDAGGYSEGRMNVLKCAPMKKYKQGQCRKGGEPALPLDLRCKGPCREY